MFFYFHIIEGELKNWINLCRFLLSSQELKSSFMLTWKYERKKEGKRSVPIKYSVNAVRIAAVYPLEWFMRKPSQK